MKFLQRWRVMDDISRGWKNFLKLNDYYRQLCDGFGPALLYLQKKKKSTCCIQKIKKNLHLRSETKNCFLFGNYVKTPKKF